MSSNFVKSTMADWPYPLYSGHCRYQSGLEWRKEVEGGCSGSEGDFGGKGRRSRAT